MTYRPFGEILAQGSWTTPTPWRPRKRAKRRDCAKSGSCGAKLWVFPANPSSAVVDKVVLIFLGLRPGEGKILHYILDSFGFVGQGEVEVVEEFGQERIGFADDAQAKFLSRKGRQHDVH